MTDLTHVEQIITRALLEGCDNHKDRAALARETARQVVEVVAAPTGWKLLPADPTPEMRAAGQQFLRSCGYGAVTMSDLWPVYRAMLAAAPDAPSVASAPPPSYKDGVNEGLRRAAKIADDWQGLEKLLPLCGPEQNAAARVGQAEAAERIHAAILSLLPKEEGDE